MSMASAEHLGCLIPRPNCVTWPEVRFRMRANAHRLVFATFMYNQSQLSSLSSGTPVLEGSKMETTMSGTTSPALPGKNWFERNWKWVVPSGCLTIIVLILGFIAGVFCVVEISIRSSDVYNQALAQAQANSQVSEKIGRPLNAGWFATGEINIHNDSGDADITIPISGPKGKGWIYAVAKKKAGVWRYETLLVEVDGQEDQINLLQSPPAPSQIDQR